jgi:hypothetical protein
MDSPIFPITFRWTKTGEVETFESMKDIECNVEHFDSDAGDAQVTDAKGRTVRIRIFMLDAETFELT